MKRIMKIIFSLVMTFALICFSNPTIVFAAHSHTDACYRGTLHNHASSCNGTVGYCSGKMTNNYWTNEQQVTCGVYQQKKYGTYSNSRTPSGSGWCPSCEKGYTITSATSTWIELYCSGCNTQVYHHHSAASCPNCGATVTSNYNWSKLDTHACYYAQCSGCSSTNGNVGQTHTKTVRTRYYDCATCGSGSTTSYGSRCGAPISGLVCGKTQGKWYYNNAVDSPTCQKVVVKISIKK